MATVKQGTLTTDGDYRRHLRRLKRRCWKRERQAGTAEAKREANNA